MGAWFEAKLTKIIQRPRPARKLADANSITPLQEMDPLNCDKGRKEMTNEIATDPGSRLNSSLSKNEDKQIGTMDATNTNPLDSKSSSDKKTSEKTPTVDENCNQVELSTDNTEHQWKEKLLAGVSTTDDGFLYFTVFDG